ncbi:hypothetical protein JANAI62_18820 [Jannaschia pagri]|uniref:Ca2+-binding protein, RTX toxin-related n=1 Tax=Jannaschia pagri TaxID=2829797 RepID=A0ABQ4NLG4_9RHOB|nr:MULTISPECIES: calcium-binding protein [unclassified Jannaschia]GIT91425.1 hypothetical protein JANAI61_18830 [Jannaschia sp. AI_61]GIT95259.1 hypothetical protein JANAI62_18820 [Jannaschia sp. AI_62]
MSATFRLTTGLDTFTGTTGNDIVEFPSNVANLEAGDIITLGAGTDTLVTERTSALGLGTDRLGGFSGLDVIDVTSPPAVTIKLLEFLLSQSDDGTLLVRFDGDPLTLDLREAGGREGFVIEGTGQVSLSDGELQWVTVADGVNGRVDGGSGSDTIEGGTGNDVLRGGGNADMVDGGAGADTLTGNGGYDVLNGGTGNDDLDGGSEDDVLEGGAGQNTATGGFGSDTFVVTAGETLTITDFEATNTFERIDLRALGSDLAFNLNFTTDGAFQVLSLGAGTTLRLSASAAAAITRDSFILPSDGDFVSKAQGLAPMADFRFTDADDTFTGGAGRQTFEVIGQFSKLAGTDFFDGGADVDTLRIWGEDRELSEGLLTGMSGIDVIDLAGASGNLGISISAAMVAQSDAGTLLIKTGGNAVIVDTAFGDGVVTVEGTGPITLRNEVNQNLTLSDQYAGSVIGGSRADKVTGGARNDTLEGGAGADTVSGEGGDDSLSGGAARDVLNGDAGDDTLEGGASHDRLNGGTGDDSLNGGTGSDVLTGGLGSNTVTGGANADTFVITPGETLTITDFALTNTYERIDLRPMGPNFVLDLNYTVVDGFGVFDLGQGTTLRLPEATAAGLTVDNLVLPGAEDFVTFATNLSTPADFLFTAGNDVFAGGDEADIFELSGQFSNLSGDDVFVGGAGDDVLRITGADRQLSFDLLRGMDGIDIIDMTATTGDLAVRIDPRMVAQSDDGTLLIKNGLNDMIVDASFGDGVITLEGTGNILLRNVTGQNVTISDDYAGNVTGGSRSDKITGGRRDDRIEGGLLDDMLAGAGGDDSIRGDGGNDTLTGGEGNDTLDGGDGRDELIADLGATTMTGGGGDDLFIIAKDAGPVTITDLDTLSFLERVDLSQIDSIRAASDVNVSIDGRDVRLTATDLDLTLKGAAGPNIDIRDFVLPGQDARIFNVTNGTPLEELQNLINGAPSGSTINLAAGTYDITETLRIDRSDITIKGAGQGQTILRAAQTDANAGQTILVQPDGQELFTDLSPIAVNAEKGTFQITLSEDHELGIGDLLFIHQENDADFIRESGNTDWIQPEPDRPEDIWLREFRSRITEIDGNVITVREPLPFDFDAGVATVRQSTYLENVVLSDFTVTGQWGETADPNNFNNTLPDEWKSIAAIELDAVENSSISRVTIEDPASHAFRFQRTYDVTGEDLVAEGAHNKGPSNGYHYYLVEAFKTTLNNVTSEDARHSVLFSSFHAEHYNEINVTETNRDINFHGSPDADNIVRVETMIQEYRNDVPSREDPQWQSVNPGVPGEHPEEAIEDNDVTFRTLQSGGRPDIVTADERGGNLNTGIGSDQLFGGSGQDTLTGGLGDDDLTGGGASDRFVYRVGDGNDQIRDFEMGAGGDVLVLQGTAFTNIGQLKVSFEQGDVVLDMGRGVDASIRLRDVDARLARPSNVEFLSDPNVEGLVDRVNAEDRFVLGTQVADTVTIFASQLNATNFEAIMGTGLDTLVVEVGNVSGIVEEIGDLSGVDIFDFTISRNLALEIGQEAVTQSDNDEITVMIGDTGDMRLNASGITDRGGLIVDGARIINLSDSGNALTLGDRIGGTVSGGDGADEVEGGAQNDRIDGGAGNDTIAGGAGEDTLTGGAGNDAFVFEVPGAALRGADRITDFQSGQDRILIDVPDGVFPTGALPNGVLRQGTAAQDANDYLIYDQATGRLFVDLNANAAGGQTLIATLDGNPELTSADFLLV